MEDDIYVSTELRTPEGAEFMNAITNVEMLMDAALASCARELYQIGSLAIELLQEGNSLYQWHDNIKLWPSAFSAIQAIVNRSTPSHCNSGASGPVFDLLVSAGTHTEAFISLGDVQARLSYNPGTVVLVCGRVLRHEVPTWEGGEHICIAHYMCDNVHERLGLKRPDWVAIDSYRAMM